MLRATARVHIKCDGQRLGRHLTAADAREAARPQEPDEWEVAPELPYRAASRVTPKATHVLRRLRTPAGAGTPYQGPERRMLLPPVRARAAAAADGVPSALPRGDGAPLLLDNGLGGLTQHGEYEIRLDGGRLPPAPWANVIANPRAGFLVTERGSSCTWAENSQFFRLTPWHNDPVSDPASEVLYVRDEDSGEVWSATPAPFPPAHATGADRPFVVRHGAGASSFEHARAGIAMHLTMGMAGDEPVKIWLLRVTNLDERRRRRISVTAYVEWCLGVLREHAQHQVQTWFDAGLATIFARNTFDPQFAGWVAFCALSEPVVAHTGDRREFLGRNGSADDPAGMRAASLSGTTGAESDPCAALRCALELAPGESREVVAVLGACPDEAAARRAAAEHRDVGVEVAVERRAGRVRRGREPERLGG
jgi:cyclic beta-1,2-glucan synthetase